MNAYQGYGDYLMAGKVMECCYILTLEGAICFTNLPIKELPRYNFDLVDENDPTKTNKVTIDERVNLLSALANRGVSKQKGGIRLYNQKYILTRFDEDASKKFKTVYLKKQKGGACICTTNTFILIGTFNVEKKMQNNQAQNPGEVNKRVEALAKTFIQSNS